MNAVKIHSDCGAQENKICYCFHLFPFHLPWSDGTRCRELSFLNVKLYVRFQFSFTLIKRLFKSSLLSAVKVVSSAYLRLLLFLPAILIPACASSSPAFRMMYSAYELNKQGDDIKPCCSPLQILRQSVIPCHFNCCYMTCIQVSQETGKVVW